jgi:hypothetical protein
MSSDELAAMFHARETLALLTWEPWLHNPKLRRRLQKRKMDVVSVAFRCSRHVPASRRALDMIFQD